VPVWAAAAAECSSVKSARSSGSSTSSPSSSKMAVNPACTSVYVVLRRLRIADATKPFEQSLKIQVGLFDVHPHVIELLDHDPPQHAMLCLRQPRSSRNGTSDRTRPTRRATARSVRGRISAAWRTSNRSSRRFSSSSAR
jgi:hypothetical protein